MSVCILNASFPVNIGQELDEYVDYRQGLNSCFSGDKIIKKCISWHSIAAAHESEFFVYKKPGWERCYEYDHVLVLIREDLNYVEPLINKLKLMKKKVGISFHENGQHFLEFCQNLNWLRDFKTLTDKSDYYLNCNESLERLFLEITNKKVFTTTHAVPHEFCKQFTVERENRKDILIGTRSFSQWLCRNTIVSLSHANYIAKKYNCEATFLCSDQVDTNELSLYLKQIGLEKINVSKAGLSYEDWIKTIARHKCIMHADQSETLGQIAADACSVMVPCYGSTSMNNFIAGTNSFMSETSKKLEDDIRSDFSNSWFNFELLKYETSYDIIRKKYQKFTNEL